MPWSSYIYDVIIIIIIIKPHLYIIIIIYILLVYSVQYKNSNALKRFPIQNIMIKTIGIDR